MQSESAQYSKECSRPATASTMKDLLWLWLEGSIKKDPDFIDIHSRTQILEDPAPNETLLQRRQHAEIKSIHAILSLGGAQGVLTRVIHPLSRESRLLSDGQRKRCLKWIGAQRSEYFDRLRAVLALSPYYGQKLFFSQILAEKAGVDDNWRIFSAALQTPSSSWLPELSELQNFRQSIARWTDDLDIFEEPTISGRLQDNHVSAFPDTGAAANFISMQHAQRLGLSIDGNLQESVKVGDGSAIRVVGTTTLPFSFAGETTTHELTFQVLRKSIHKVILGSAFLRVSETFTRFAHRVGRKFREAVSPGTYRISFLGSQQYVNGQANGVQVDAVPDTGADVSVMSASFAESNAFEIDDDEQHRILLGFVDGSTARARGVVRGVAWRYGADTKTHHTDVYVLPSLPVSLLLGYSFLRQTDAFVEHENDFWHDETSGPEGTSKLCVIRVLGRPQRSNREEFSCEYYHDIVATEEPRSDRIRITAHAAEESWLIEKASEISSYRKAKEEAKNMRLSDEEQTTYLQPHVVRWQKFLATRPGSLDNSSPALDFESLPLEEAIHSSSRSWIRRCSLFRSLRSPRRKRDGSQVRSHVQHIIARVVLGQAQSS